MSLVPYGEGMCSAGGLKGSEVFAAAGLKARGEAIFSAVGAGGAEIYCKKYKHQARMPPSCIVYTGGSDLILSIVVGGPDRRSFSHILRERWSLGPMLTSMWLKGLPEGAAEGLKGCAGVP